MTGGSTEPTASTTGREVQAVAFDLFGTLVTADRPADPAAAIAERLEAGGCRVPDDFGTAYERPHRRVPEGEELSLPVHVADALAACREAVDPPRETGTAPPDLGSPGTGRTTSAVDGVDVAEAVLAAFDRPVETRSGAGEAIAAAAEVGPVGICSNCSVPGLVDQVIERSGLDPTRVDAVVTSVECGYRKPDRRIFEAAATRLGVDPDRVLHVGDDPQADGGIEAVGGTFLSVETRPPSAVSEQLEEQK